MFIKLMELKDVYYQVCFTHIISSFIPFCLLMSTYVPVKAISMAMWNFPSCIIIYTILLYYHTKMRRRGTFSTVLSIVSTVEYSQQYYREYCSLYDT